MTKQQLDLISKRLAAFIQDYIEENGIKPSTLNCVRWAFKDSDEELQSLKEHIESLQGQLVEAKKVIKKYTPKRKIYCHHDDPSWCTKDCNDYGFAARAYLKKYRNHSETPNS